MFTIIIQKLNLNFESIAISAASCESREKQKNKKQQHSITCQKSERGAKHMFVRTLPFLGSWLWLFPVLLLRSHTQLVYMYDGKASPAG